MTDSVSFKRGVCEDCLSKDQLQNDDGLPLAISGGGRFFRTSFRPVPARAAGQKTLGYAPFGTAA